MNEPQFSSLSPSYLDPTHSHAPTQHTATIHTFQKCKEYYFSINQWWGRKRRSYSFAQPNKVSRSSLEARHLYQLMKHSKITISCSFMEGFEYCLLMVAVMMMVTTTTMMTSLHDKSSVISYNSILGPNIIYIWFQSILHWLLKSWLHKEPLSLCTWWWD